MRYIKEKITSVSQNSDSKTFIIQRFKSNESNKNWKLDSVWAGTLKPDRLIIYQNNQEILKLIFPVTENLEWNLNTYLNAKPKLAKYENINKAFESNKLNFENIENISLADCLKIALTMSKNYSKKIYIISNSSTEQQNIIFPQKLFINFVMISLTH